MRRKYIATIMFALILCVSVAFSQECYFDTYSTECQRLDTPYNDFNVGVTSQDELSKVEIEVFNVDNPSNKLMFDQDNFKISQVMPFLEPGVYSITVRAYDLAGNLKNKSFEYIFDNLQPMPPIVGIDLRSPTTSFVVNGKTNPGQRVAVDVRSAAGSFQTFSSSPSGSIYSLPIALSLGVNYARFYAINENGVKSAYVERVILAGDITEMQVSDANSISINNLVALNDRTVGGFTSKRNFYVQGTTSGASVGSVVFVNGVRAIVDQSGKFGAFVLLNQGANEIIVSSDNFETEPVEFDYVDLQFKILDATYDKIVSQSTVVVTGSVNFDYPMLAFQDGQFLREVTPSNGVFSVQSSTLNPGKNFVELRGINGQRVTDIIYYDVENPVAVQISQNKMVQGGKLVFELGDDIGININSVVLNINNQVLDANSLEVKGDFYVFDLEGFQDGVYTYVLRGEDLAGKLFSLNGQININEDNTVIKSILANGEMIGNHIYTNSGDFEMIMVPSRNIAFKSIYLDGVEQTEYNILSNNNIRLKVDVEGVTGTLNMVFINQDYVSFSENFVYHSDKEEPVIKLDYVEHPYTIQKVKVSGEIIDSNFDWSSLKFNGQTSFTRYGNYFEAIIDVTGRNLVISGEDFAGNSFSEEYGYLLYKDVSETVIQLGGDSLEIVDEINGTMPDSDEHRDHIGVLNFIDSYDGFQMNEVYLASDGFSLPVQDRPGYRSLNIRGFESSGLEFNSNHYIRVLPTTDPVFVEDETEPPVIHFSGNDNVTDETNHTIQGQIVSGTNITSVEIDGGGHCVFDDTSFVCDVVLEEGDNTFTVTVTDENGNSSSSTIDIEKIVDDLNVIINDIFGQHLQMGGGDNYLFGDTVSLDAEVSKEAVIKILINGNEILDGVHDGQFELELDVSGVVDGIEESEISFQLKAEDEEGNEAYSNVVKVLYQRVFETFAKVWVR